MNQTETNIAYLARKRILAAVSKKNNQGFTLIELLLYIGIVSVILASVSVFLFIILQSDVKNQAIVEVEQQGAQMMQRITHKIRNAESVNSPSPGQSSTNLSLNTGSINISDFAFSEVVASDLIFTNLSKNNTPGIIRIQFTLSYNNPENKQEYDYSKTFYSSASLR
jgi:type II secretory pathway pseudopilin PulG